MDAFKLPQMPNPPRPQVRVPRLRNAPTFAAGPRFVQTIRRSIKTGGPGLAPEGFVGGTTSQDEWIWYWASKRKLDPYDDPREPPFRGGALWEFQSAELGAFTRQRGSAVVDFLYKVSNPPLAVRIVTYEWHLTKGAGVQANDRIQLAQLAGRFDVVDVYSQDYLADDTGEAAIVLLTETLGLGRRQDPLTAGTVRQVRNPLSR